MAPGGSRPGAGRPSLLTTKLRDEICEMLKQGQPKRSAAALAGIHYDTLRRWEVRGRAARALRDEGMPVPRRELPYLHLVDEVEFSFDFGEGWLMQQAVAAAQGKIKARATDFVMLLERTRPDQWRRRSSAEYTDRGNDKTPRQRIDVSKLDKAERQQLRELLQKARDADASN